MRRRTQRRHEPFAKASRPLVPDVLPQAMDAFRALLGLVARSRCALVLVVAGVTNLSILRALNSVDHRGHIRALCADLAALSRGVRVGRDSKPVWELHVSVGL